jgi:hypothetical protein
MPKKKSSRPAASLGSSQSEEPKSGSQIRRERIIRMGAILLVLALLLSLLAGAFSVAPAQAAISGKISPVGNSVQILQADDSPTGADLDTDSDGIINNEDPDIDNDGVVNANDPDIDGDGTPNFDDGDPAATNGFDGNKPRKPGEISIQDLAENGTLSWLFGVLAVLIIGVGLIVRKSLKKRGKTAQKNL